MTSKSAALFPYDEHNQILEANAHPTDWVNPKPERPYHLVVIGAGAAGLVTAAGAAGLGARVALVERELMGGDCLNVGCVPSKALIRSARDVARARDAVPLGVDVGNGRPDFAAIMERMRRLRARISPADSVDRFSKLGVDVFLGEGAFESDRALVVRRDGASTRLEFRKAVVATGARAAAPPISGLDQVPHLTNETLFSLTQLPPRLGVVGSGPIGAEMAQTFARLGSSVVLFERARRILPREDADAAEIVQRQMTLDGVQWRLDSQDMRVQLSEDGKILVRAQSQGQTVESVVDQLLIAAGRRPNVEGLNLEHVGVRYDEQGVVVNDHLQTSNPRIFAAGDICASLKFTHAADFMARIVLQNALFAVGPFGRRRVSDLIIPWTTYTSPEVAHVGVYEGAAVEAGLELDTYLQPLAEVDRAILDGEDKGFVRVHTKRGSDRILGATIVAENAGDLISEITVAMKNNIGLGQLAATIHPYPTQADAIRKLGDQYNRTRLTPRNQKILSLLRWFNVGA